MNKGFHRYQKPKYEDRAVQYGSTSSQRMSENNSVFNRSTKYRKDMVGRHSLSDLIEKHSNEILLILSVPQNGLCHLLDNIKATDRDLVSTVLNVITKACESQHQKNVVSLLSDVFQSKNFTFCTLPQYLVGSSEQKSEEAESDSLLKLLDLLTWFSQYLPASASDVLTVVLPLLEIALENVFAEDQSALKSLLKRIEVLKEQEAVFINSHSRKDVLKASKAEKINVQQPPNDFRTIPIFPTREDILEFKPFLRPNITTGSYIDTEHYLDVQFRLLREDYVRPFRVGISKYLSLSENQEFVHKIEDVRIYHNVCIVKQIFHNGMIVHLAQFNKDKFKNVNWEYTKRFLTGSLLCFSCDNFQNMFFATVADRKCELLNVGILILKFENLAEDKLNIDPNLNFIVVESNAYFEAYRHNLSALCRMADVDFSMQKYIIHLQKNVEAPLYLEPTSTYDMQPLLQQMNDPLMFDFLSCSSDTCMVPLLDYNQWPNEKDFHLDRSQYEALQAALTKELAIIQGPPGTGKTYIGLRIVQLLLHNVSTTKVGPIFIFCYTNHALDQFLEGILQFNKDIIRVGGRCENEVVKPYMLRNAKFSSRERKISIPSHIYLALKEQKIFLAELKKDIDNTYMSIYECSHNVLSEHILCYYMHRQHYDAFRYYFQMQRGNAMHYWLGVQFSGVNEHKLANTVRKDLSAAYAKKLACMKDKLYYVEEDDIQFYEDMHVVEDVVHDEIDSFRVELKGDSESETDDFDSAGWQMAGGKKRLKKNMKKNLKSSDLMSANEAKRIRDIWYLSLENRWRLYRYWVKQYVDAQRQKLLYFQGLLLSEYEKLTELKQEEDAFILCNSKVVGMTTTGAAKYHNIIHEIKPQIVIIEEAAEILESHIVATLTDNTEHLILIGDHQQLRPNPTVYELAARFNLNVSLFERMVNNGVEYHQLSVQHRMRPCIASLLVPHIYPVLDNHESVLNFENIKGVCKNMFFLNHNVPEKDEQDSHSHVNFHEAEFIVELCIYLLQQGYDESQITILTTYSGQLFAIRRLMQNRICQRVRVTVVDNFQGEENDIILMSFVRSNDEGNIGFINMPNRICVALSRARKGFFCIGNFQLFAEKSDLWKKITTTLAESNLIGKSLRLQCQNHPDAYQDVSKGSDFASVPEGGCDRPCEYRLTCGHACASKCHPCDLSHEKYLCKKPCLKIICENKHKCPKECHETCDLCEVSMEKTFPDCGHAVSFPCSVFSSELKCCAPCSKTLQCGHQCKQQCFETCSVRCTEKITIKLLCNHEIEISCHESKDKEDFSKNCSYICSAQLKCGHTCMGTCGKCSQGTHQDCHENCTRTRQCGHQCQGLCFQPCTDMLCIEKAVIKLLCGHEMEITCFESENKEHFLQNCSYPCSAQLWCGHACTGSCSTCYQGRLHQVCYETCNRRLICGHQCKEPCAKSCPPCEVYCENICGHGSSVRKCGAPSIPCFQPCLRSCKHQKCTNLCSDLCSYEHCSEPCSKVLQCGHDCLGLCSEPCPDCIVCMPDLVEEVHLSSGDSGNCKRKFIQLQECKHVFEVKKLENWIETCERSESIQAIVCPKCSMVIRKNDYFMNSIKRCAMKIEKIKHNVLDAEKFLLDDDDVKYNFISFWSSEKSKYPELFSVIMHPMFQFLNKSKNMHCSTLVRCLNIIIMSRNIFKLEHIYEDIGLAITLKTEINPDHVNRLCEFIENTRDLLIAFFNTEYLTASKIQMRQMAREVLRYELLLWLIDFITNSATDNQRNIFEVKYQEIVENLCKYEPFKSSHEIAVKQSLMSFGSDVSCVLDFKAVSLFELNFSEDSFAVTDIPFKVMLNTLMNKLQSSSIL